LRPIGEWSCRALSVLADRPILFRRGDFIFVTYGLFVAAGAALFTQQTTALWLAQGLPKSHVAALHFFDVLSASFFGHAFWWLAHRRELAPQPRFGLKNIGFVSYGALAGLLFSCSVFALLHRASLGLITDALVRGMFLAYAVGRLGCVSFGCCWGTPTAVAGILYRNPVSKVLRLTGRAQALCRPAAAYLCLEGLVLFVFLNLLALLPLPAGVLTALSLVLYSLGRFFIESVRERTRFIFGRFHEGHLGSAATAAAGLAFLLFLPKSAALPGPRLWDPAVIVPSFSLAPISFLVGAFVFIVAGIHRKKVGSW
jgi:phosphatidylglycerol:prolipoprotein diacylglycerol transferase